MATIYPNCNELVAHLPGVIGAVADTAKAGGRRAEGILAGHHHLGHARITVTHGSVDSFVSLDDARGQHAAAAIEYGRSGGKRGASQGIFALRGAF